MEGFLIIGGAVVLAVGLLMLRRLKYGPDGGGFMKEKPGLKKEPIAWRVERRRQFQDEPERVGATLLWYPVKTYAGPEAEARANAKATEYHELWRVLTQVVPVRPTKEG